MRNEIVINGIKLYAYHGCMPEEAKMGQEYIVNLRLKMNFANAANTDNLEFTIDYVDVYALVKEEMQVRSKLIEHVGKRILDSLKAKFKSLEQATVEIRKINPPINGHVSYVSVILEE